jgi:hypothetical protein
MFVNNILRGFPHFSFLQYRYCEDAVLGCFLSMLFSFLLLKQIFEMFICFVTLLFIRVGCW